MVKQLMLENSGVSNLQGQAPAVMAAIIPAAPPPNLALSSKTHQIQRSGENKHVKQFEENVFEYLNPGRRLNIDQVSASMQSVTTASQISTKFES